MRRGISRIHGRIHRQRAAAPALIPALLLAMALLLTLACGSEAATPTPPPATTAPPTPTAEMAAADTAAAGTDEAGGMAADEPELTVVLATTALAVGPQRLAFLLASEQGLIKNAAVTVTPVYVPDGAAQPPLSAEYHEWPYGVRGAYAGAVEFDRPGPWRLDITADGGTARDEAAGGRASLDIEVGETTPVPGLGMAAPLSDNKTLGGGQTLEQITTDYTPDPELYRLTVREAVGSGRPTLVVFASPAFCTSATCGPQVDTVAELRETYAGQANFIHIEIYDNPDEIQGDLEAGRLSPAVDEWGLSALPHWFNESWTFVLDGAGVIRGRFEGFATRAELETSLKAALRLN